MIEQIIVLIGHLVMAVRPFFGHGLIIGAVWWVIYLIGVVVIHRILPKTTPTEIVITILSAVPILVCLIVIRRFSSLGYEVVVVGFYGLISLSPIFIPVGAMVLAFLDQR